MTFLIFKTEKAVSNNLKFVLYLEKKNYHKLA